MTVKNSLFETKILIIQKDIDEAFSIYNNSNSNINNLRGWSLTISLAYLGFLITIQASNYHLLLPYISFQLLFMYLEAIERDFANEASDLLFNIKSIFLETDQSKFENHVLSYQFRGSQNRHRPFISIQIYWKRIKIMFIYSSLLWYLLQFILLFLGIYAIKNGIFIISKT